MTTLELIATLEADKAITSALREHERQASVEQRKGHPLTARNHLSAAKRLRRYGPSELLVVQPIDPVDGGRNER